MFTASAHSVGCTEKPATDGDVFVLSDQDTLLECDPVGWTTDALACQLAYETNRERRGHPVESQDAGACIWDWTLADIALSYSFRMCDEGFFDHEDPQGRRMGDRLAEEDVLYVKAGENLAQGENLMPRAVMALYMNEPPCRTNHRGNVLDRVFTHTGVGAVSCGDDVIYTQLFAAFDVDAMGNARNDACRTDP